MSVELDSDKKRIYSFPPSSSGGERTQIPIGYGAEFSVWYGDAGKDYGVLINGFVLTPTDKSKPTLTLGRAVQTELKIPGGIVGGIRFPLLQSALAPGPNQPDVLCYMEIMDAYGVTHKAGAFRECPTHTQPPFHDNPKFNLINVNAGNEIDRIGFSLSIG
jgi:hypothetical protein